MISDEEAWHTIERGGYYVIRPMLPELLKKKEKKRAFKKEYSSADFLMNLEDTKKMLKKYHLLIEQQKEGIGEMLV